eukprot:m.249573 g.249573  ORF g.249573 m.249573 type:complete len:121 (+) comp40304_c1_seq14:361-723(+)
MNYIYDNSPDRWEVTASSCPNTDCRMTHEEKEKASADGILLNRFVPLRYKDQLRRYHDRQVLFVLNMEGEKEPEWSDPSIISQWDFKIGYKCVAMAPIQRQSADSDSPHTSRISPRRKES